jgi:hypothetical protein
MRERMRNSAEKLDEFKIIKHRQSRDTSSGVTQPRTPPKAGLLLVSRFFPQQL